MGRQLTQHFHSNEFNCKDGTPVPARYYDALEELCRTFLEPMRDKFGSCTINSGFRTPEHNRNIGGARSSYHVYVYRDPDDGVAADVRFAKGSVRDWWRKANRLRRRRRKGRGGLGYYPQGGFIHVDNRPYKADWNGS